MATKRAVDGVHASGRDLYPVHPCAGVFPMLSDDELDLLSQDITANGLREAIVIWRACDDRSDQIYILDGRNRMEALARLGVRFPLPGPETEFPLEAEFPDGHTDTVFRWCHTAEPAKYVIGANIRRRHLTKEQQAELILLALQAGRNDVANLARSFSPIAGQRGGSSKDQLLDAAVEEGTKLDISRRTMRRARSKLLGVTKPRRNKPKDGSATRATTSDASALETSGSFATPAAVSKKTAAITRAVESAIHQAEKQWPHGEPLLLLIVMLKVEADRLDKRDEEARQPPMPSTAATTARGRMLPSGEAAYDVQNGRG